MSKFLNSKKLQIIVVIVLTALAYSNIFQNEFVSDDRGFIAGWATTTKISDILQIIAGDGPPFRREATYRPIRDSIYAIYGQIFGKNTFGWHLHSLLVHLGVTVLVYLIVRELQTTVYRLQSTAVDRRRKAVDNSYFSFMAALLFGLHPVHTEAITFMTSGMDMTGVLFMFAAFYLYLRAINDKGYNNYKNYKFYTSLGLATLAFFTYEMTLVLPILIVLAEYTLISADQKRMSADKIKSALVKFGPYFAAAGVYVLVRVFLIGRVPGGTNYWIDNTSFNWSRFMEPEVILTYLKVLFFPVHLSFNHMIRPGFDTFLAWVNDPGIFANYSLWPTFGALLLIFAIIILALKFGKNFPLLTFGVLWFFIAQLPFANIAGQPAIMAERYIYIASFGFILAILHFWFLMPRRIGILLMVVLAIFWGSLTYLRNFDWRDGVSVWKSVLNVYPESALGYNNVGKEYVDKKEYELAASFYQKALEFRPGYFYASNDLALTYMNLDKLDFAEAQFKKTLAINENYIQAHLGLANLYRKLGLFDKAVFTLKRALAVKQEDTPLSDKGFSFLMSDIYNDIGLVYREDGRIKEANEAFVSSLKLDPQSRVAYNNLRELIVDNPSLWARREGELGSFSYPQFWKIVEGGEKYILISDDRRFRIELRFSELNQSVDNFLSGREDNYGEIVSEEFTNLGSFKRAFVKVWRDETSHKIQFFLFDKGKTVEILAYPSESSLKKIIDGIIGTIEIE